MPGIDSATGTFVVPIWAAGAVAALFVVVCVMAFSRAGQTGTISTIVRYAAVLIGALLALTFIDRSAMRDRAAERRALEARATELTARAIMPGSALACLDAIAGDKVETSCERAVFANSVGVAAAVSYVAARLTLLADGLAYAKSDDRGYGATLAALRKAVARDRFGLVAHVLATRHGCNADRCAAFALVDDAKRLKTNLKMDTFAGLVERHALTWTTANAKPAPAPAPAPAAPSVSILPNVDFPSAASIPPVSIMEAEPKTDKPAVATASPPPVTAPPPAAKPPAPRRSVRRPPTNGNAAKPAPAPPIMLVPPPTAFDATAPTRAQ